MLVYVIYDKSTGKIVHMHRAVDVAGRSSTCSKEDVLRVLPGNINPKAVGIISTEMDQAPSARDVAYSVNMETGALIKTPVTDRTTRR